MERIIETVTVTAKSGVVTIFDVVEDSERWTGRRAYVRESTQYYAGEVFEKGLASGRAAQVERQPRQ